MVLKLQKPKFARKPKASPRRTRKYFKSKAKIQNFQGLRNIYHWKNMIKRETIKAFCRCTGQGCKSLGNQISGRNPAQPGPTEILGRNGPAQLKSWAGPGRSCLILFLSVFLKDFWKKIWTLLLTHFKLSIFILKNGGISAKSSWNLDKKRPGPA